MSHAHHDPVAYGGTVDVPQYTPRAMSLGAPCAALARWDLRENNGSRGALLFRRCWQKAAAANTADTTLIGETAERVDAVLAEGLQHHLFLGRVLDKVRT